MPRVPVEELQPPDAGQRLARPLRDGVHRAEGVLRRVARAHAAADARLVGRREARPVERRPALHLVPDVDHRVQIRVGRLDDEAREVRVPVVAQRAERRVGGGGVAVRGDRPPSLVRRRPRSRARRRSAAPRPVRARARGRASRCCSRAAPRFRSARPARRRAAPRGRGSGRRTPRGRSRSRRAPHSTRRTSCPGGRRSRSGSRRPRSGCARCAAPSRGSAGRRGRPDS